MSNSDRFELQTTTVLPKFPEQKRVTRRTLNLLEQFPSMDDVIDLNGATRKQAIETILKGVNTVGMTQQEIIEKLQLRTPQGVKFPHEHTIDESIAVNLINLIDSPDPVERHEAIELLVINAQHNLLRAKETSQKGILSEAEGAANLAQNRAKMETSGLQWYRHDQHYQWALESLCGAAFLQAKATYPHSLPLAE